jgi:hypothetical protein
MVTTNITDLKKSLLLKINFPFELKLIKFRTGKDWFGIENSKFICNKSQCNLNR